MIILDDLYLLLLHLHVLIQHLLLVHWACRSNHLGDRRPDLTFLVRAMDPFQEMRFLFTLCFPFSLVSFLRTCIELRKSLLQLLKVVCIRLFVRADGYPFVQNHWQLGKRTFVFVLDFWNSRLVLKA